MTSAGELSAAVDSLVAQLDHACREIKRVESSVRASRSKTVVLARLTDGAVDGARFRASVDSLAKAEAAASLAQQRLKEAIDALQSYGSGHFAGRPAQVQTVVDDGGLVSASVGIRGKNMKTTVFDPKTGRPISESGTIVEDFGSSPRGDNATAIGRTGIPGDQGGHLGAHRFFGDSHDAGIVPQAGNLNQGAWKRMENEWADWVAAGYRVDYAIEVFPPGAIRPDKFKVAFTVTNPVTGEAIRNVNRQLFKNETGQKYERFPRNQMSNPLGGT